MRAGTDPASELARRINRQRRRRLATRAEDIEGGLADVISVDTMALASPDLVERAHTNAPQRPRPNTSYGGGEAGHTDDRLHAA